MRVNYFVTNGAGVKLRDLRETYAILANLVFYAFGVVRRLNNGGQKPAVAMPCHGVIRLRLWHVQGNSTRL